MVKRYRVIAIMSLSLAGMAFLATTTLGQSSRMPSQTPPGQTPPTMPSDQGQPGSQQPTMKQEAVKTFSGKISMSNGKYVLQDSTSNTSYVLDNQKKAKKFEGQNVMVTGTLDTDKNKIHVKKIEPASA